MTLIQTRDKALLQAFLEQQRALNAYALGDLDEPYWSRTDWFAWQQSGQITELALLYKGFDPPILLALQNNDHDNMRALLEELRPHLPDHVYAHLSPSLVEILEPKYAVQDHGEHTVMELRHLELIGELSAEDVVALNSADFASTKELYDAAYPGHWFRHDMLDLGPYFGIRNGDGRLLSAGGVHIFSQKYDVATLGNITTLPSNRGQGLGKRVSAKLCQALIAQVNTIGLNVKADNVPAIKIYRDLGFEPIATYSEFTLIKK